MSREWNASVLCKHFRTAMRTGGGGRLRTSATLRTAITDARTTTILRIRLRYGNKLLTATVCRYTAYHDIFSLTISDVMLSNVVDSI